MGRVLYLTMDVTPSRSLNLMPGALCRSVYCRKRSKALMLIGRGWLPVPRWVLSVRLNRSCLRARPISLQVRQSGVGDIQQRVLLRRVHGHAEFTRHRLVDKFNIDVASDAI